MAYEFKVSRKNAGCEENIVDDYVAVLNGIAVCCHKYDEYQEGYRNQIAVDLTVAADMLCLDPYVVLEEFEKAGLIRDYNDDEDPETRVSRVMNYSTRFCWDYMISPYNYVSASKYLDDECPLCFVIED